MRSPRYGASNRKLVDKAIKAKRTRYECPACHKLKLKRKGNSVWKCMGKACGKVYAGAAYAFESEPGQIAKRLIAEYAKAA